MLIIPQHIIDEMTVHALALSPVECCGILGGTISGDVARVTHMYQVRNEDQSIVSYFMDPRELLWVQKNLRQNTLELLVIYHSHTHTPAYPSATDVRLAFYPEAVYMIISLQEKEQPDINAFRIVNGRIDAVEYTILREGS